MDSEIICDPDDAYGIFRKELVKREKANRHLEVDGEKVEQGLARLVLTLLELIRRLMEKQAIRRIDGGTLTDEQIDELGMTFMKLDEKIKELMEIFNLKDGDLNLDLGPLGNLM